MSQSEFELGVQKEETNILPILAAFRANFSEDGYVRTPFDRQVLRLKIEDREVPFDEQERRRAAFKKAGLSIQVGIFDIETRDDIREQFEGLPASFMLEATTRRMFKALPTIISGDTKVLAGYREFMPHREFLLKRALSALPAPEQIDPSTINAQRLLSDFARVGRTVSILVPRNLLDHRLRFQATFPQEKSAYSWLAEQFVEDWDVRRTKNHFDVSLFTLRKSLSREGVDPRSVRGSTLGSTDSFWHAAGVMTGTNGKSEYERGEIGIRLLNTKANRQSVAVMQRLTVYQNLKSALLN